MNEYPIGVTVEEGLKLILNKCSVLETEKVSIEEASGRILSEDIISKENIPPFDRSPFDGYAFKAEDVVNASKNVPVTLSIIEEVPAGHSPTKKVKNGEAVKILTGAPIPDGADVVVKFEDTKFTGTQVSIQSSYKSGTNIIPAGEDVTIGDMVITNGTELVPSLVGLLAGLGYSKVNVYRKPIVALLSTGDEIIGVNEKITPGKIRNSSIYNLKAYIEKCGCEVILLGIAKDNDRKIADIIEKGVFIADVVVTTGGVSVGDYDMVKNALEILKADIMFWKVKMKPGAAFISAMLNNKLILCLSGNPSAAANALFLFGIPAFRKISGNKLIYFEKIKVRFASDFPKKSPTRRLIPGKLTIIDGQAYLVSKSRQGNGMLSPMTGFDILADIPSGSNEIHKDDLIEAFYIF